MSPPNQLLQFIIDEEDFWDDVVMTLLSTGLIQLEDYNIHYKRPCRTRPFSGHNLITDIMSGHPDRGYSHFRMTNYMFQQLEQLLVSRGVISGTRNVTSTEQLAFFLYCVGYGVSNRVLSETFNIQVRRYQDTLTKFLKGFVP